MDTVLDSEHRLYVGRWRCFISHTYQKDTQLDETWSVKMPLSRLLSKV